MGRSCLDFVHPDDIEKTKAAITSLESQEEVSNFENRYRCRDGTYRWIEWRSRSQGRLIYAAARDITERKNAEERLYLAMLAANDGLWDWNIAADQVFFDSRFYTLAGYEPEEFPCLFTEWSGRIHPDDAERWQTELHAHLQGKTAVFDADYRFLHRDGSWMWIRGRGKGVEYDVQGRMVRMVGTHTSITNRKRAEAEREKLQEQLTQAQKMESVGRLAGGVAHDFNNMLSVILGRTEMALVGMDEGEPLHATLQEISKAAGRSALLTRQLLAFARKQTVALRVLDLNETVTGMLTMLRRLIGENIDLAWIPAKNLQPVKMDSSQIDQVLANLCVNCRDAISDTGRIVIETDMVIVDESYCAANVDCIPGEYVRLSVSDNGCGMDRETMSHLFEPFFTTKETGKGTGLGLATVYGIVKQNKGFIHVYSEPGQGSTFTIYLPPHFVAGERTVPVDAVSPVEHGNETILLVEDEPMILEMTATMIQLQGYTVLCAATPGEAIRLACEHAGQIDMLITDVVMPEMNGRDLARNLFSIYPGIKRLFMSGYTANVIAHHGVLDEGVHFMQKPFTMDELAAKIREVLEEK